MPVNLIYNPGDGDRRISVLVPPGSNGKIVMDKAAEVDPCVFSYTYKEFPFGIMVTSIGGVTPPDGYFWELLVGPDECFLHPSNVGISAYHPAFNTVIKWVISKITK